MPYTSLCTYVGVPPFVGSAAKAVTPSTASASSAARWSILPLSLPDVAIGPEEHKDGDPGAGEERGGNQGSRPPEVRHRSGFLAAAAAAVVVHDHHDARNAGVLLPVPRAGAHMVLPVRDGVRVPLPSPRAPRVLAPRVHGVVPLAVVDPHLDELHPVIVAREPADQVQAVHGLAVPGMGDLDPRRGDPVVHAHG